MVSFRSNFSKHNLYCSKHLYASWFSVLSSSTQLTGTRSSSSGLCSSFCKPGKASKFTVLTLNTELWYTYIYVDIYFLPLEREKLQHMQATLVLLLLAQQMSVFGSNESWHPCCCHDLEFRRWEKSHMTDSFTCRLREVVHVRNAPLGSPRRCCMLQLGDGGDASLKHTAAAEAMFSLMRVDPVTCARACLQCSLCLLSV